MRYLLALGLLLSTLAAVAQPTHPTAALLALMQRYHVPGMQVVYTKGRTTKAYNLGVREAGSSQPVTAATTFEAASLGTPAVISDPDIAAELGAGFWQVPEAPVSALAERAGSVSALAETLRIAAFDITAGTAPVPDSSIRERFRQSSRTAAMVEAYERARA